MTARIRVRILGTGHERTIGQNQYDAQPDAFTVLDKAAVDAGGVDIPPKYKTSVSAEAEKKAASRASTASSSTGDDEKAAKSVDQNKEN